MGVTLTEKAAGEVKKIMTEQQLPAETVLRVGIQGGGCSGFSYLLGFDTQYDPSKDTLEEQHGVKLAIDKKSALFLDGSAVDFHDGIDRRGFVFNTPNAVKTCGCGSSFST